MIPENITKDHIEKAIAEIDKEGIRKGRHSSTYDLVYNGKSYPPKLVISIANRFANGKELSSSSFKGGSGTDAFSLLESMNFVIKEKQVTPFQSLMEQVKPLVEEKGFHCKTKIKGRQYLSIGDKSNEIGGNLKQTHYEFVDRNGSPSLELHFEDPATRDLFKKNVAVTNDNIEWFKWMKGESIRYKESYDINDSNLPERLVNDLQKFDDIIGGQVRETIMQIQNPEMQLNTFSTEASRFEPDDFNTYIDFLRVVVNHFGIKKGDERVVFSVRARRLNFTVGQRYCFNLYLSKPEGRFGAISIDKLREGAEAFAGVPPQPYYNYWKSFDVTEEEKQSILKGIEQELQRTNKSGYTKYNNEDFENYVFEEDIEKHTSMEYPLNTILYGPPGTGKTYLTIKRAAEIVSNRPLDNYDEALTIFNEHLGENKQIEFITFHQNYSYEDFIQGLRPDVEAEGDLSFRKSEGVFKRLADRALENLKLSDKAPEEVSREALFDEALERLSDLVQESDDYIPINDSTYIMDVDDSAFRYSGANWVRHQAGIRMKFSDLKEFYLNDISDRKEIKSMSNISQLAKQHATYYLLVYKMVLKHLPKKNRILNVVPKKNYVIVIDEINRANISRVFGELITLIEPDKRSHGAIPLRAKLPSGDVFTVPSNLYIIGTMNTADKSIALLDIALRRRFEFEAMYPNYRLDGVYDADVLEKINKEIIEGKGHDFQIGHAYFMGDNEDLVKRMNKKVIPLLLEYYMNDDKEVTRILTKAGLQVNTAAWPLEITGKA